MSAAVLAVSFNAAAQDTKEKNKDKDKEKKEWSDDKDRIEGSGNIVTRDVSVQSFDALTAKGVFNVILTQGSKEAVKIEADDNLQDLFEVKNEGSELKIEMKKHSNFNSKKGLKVYVTFKSLKKMELNMVGNLTSQGNLSFNDLSLNNESVGSVDLAMTTQKLNLQNKSVGSLKLSGKADNAVIKHNSVGSLKASDFVVQSLDIENDGIGSAEVNAAKEIKVKDSFLGKVKNVGSATVKKVKDI